MTITLEAVKAEQEKIAAMIANLEAQAQKPSFFEYNGTRFELNQGEIYFTTVITPTIKFHSILLPGESEEGTWSEISEWAVEQGGELFDRVEGAILFQTLKNEFKQEAYWTCETHANDTAYAWFQNFYNGHQRYYRKGIQLRGRAVRRLVFQ